MNPRAWNADTILPTGSKKAFNSMVFGKMSLDDLTKFRSLLLRTATFLRIKLPDKKE